MPKIIKKRPVKKRPVEEEEVANAARHALDTLKAKQRQTIIIVAAIAIVAILIAAVNFYTSSQNNKVEDLQKEAFMYYYGEKPYDNLPDADRWAKARDLFQGSVEVKLTPTSLYYLGNSYYNLGDYGNAIKQYTLFTDKLGSEYEMLPLVYQKLAAAYFKTGSNDKALEVLGKLAQLKNGNFKDTALLMEARYYEGIGDRPKAIEKYRQLAGEFPQSPWSPEATAKVTQAERPAEPADTQQSTPPQEPVTK